MDTVAKLIPPRMRNYEGFLGGVVTPPRTKVLKSFSIAKFQLPIVQAQVESQGPIGNWQSAIENLLCGRS